MIGLDQRRLARVVAQGLAQLADRGLQRSLGGVGWPERVEKFGFRDQAGVAFGQIDQQGEQPGRQGNGPVAAAQFAAFRIEIE
ncbi:MAG: hypothetical protein R3D85_14845 [Paracoccaceae bacterium]